MSEESQFVGSVCVMVKMLEQQAITKWEIRKGLLKVENIVNVINKCRKCNVYYVKDGQAAECENIADSENEISVSGMFSEVVDWGK